MAADPLLSITARRVGYNTVGYGGAGSLWSFDVDVRYYIDSDSGEPHIYGHRITEVEVEFVLNNAGEDLPAKDNSRQALGQTAAGRYLRVIYVPDPDPNSVFVITAYELHGKALLAYRRRRRRKKK